MGDSDRIETSDGYELLVRSNYPLVIQSFSKYINFLNTLHVGGTREDIRKKRSMKAKNKLIDRKIKGVELDLIPRGVRSNVCSPRRRGHRDTFLPFSTDLDLADTGYSRNP